MSGSDDGALAAGLARNIGTTLVRLRTRTGFSDPEGLRGQADILAHELVTGMLAMARPGDALLSEEGTDDLDRVSADRVWIVDPLDGTREFGEPGRSDWAVQVALWAGEQLAAGAVALPALGRTLWTGSPSRAADGAGGGRLRITASRSRRHELVDRLLSAFRAELVPLGSVGAKTDAVLRGEVDAYVHAGGFHEWDCAAPVAVAVAAGLHASRLDGSALAFNQAVPYVPDLIICRPTLADRLLEALAACMRQSGISHEGHG